MHENGKPGCWILVEGKLTKLTVPRAFAAGGECSRMFTVTEALRAPKFAKFTPQRARSRERGRKTDDMLPGKGRCGRASCSSGRVSHKKGVVGQQFSPSAEERLRSKREPARRDENRPAGARASGLSRAVRRVRRHGIYSRDGLSRKLGDTARKQVAKDAIVYSGWPGGIVSITTRDEDDHSLPSSCQEDAIRIGDVPLPVCIRYILPGCSFELSRVPACL